MSTSMLSSLNVRSINRYSLATAVAWTLLVAGSLAWNMHNERTATIELAKIEAQATFNKDQAFRFWATKHGGVYVRVTEEMQPNPYLSHIPDRDIKLSSGRQLTLMNPAFIMRQVMKEFEILYGVKGHITSLKPLNPVNTPDPWEVRTLGEMERGVEEVFEIDAVDGKRYLNLMRPMTTQKGCLKCHARQGYKAGDIRGGVRISLPLEPFFSRERPVMVNMTLSHGIIYLIGMGGIGFISRRTKEGVVRQLEAQEALRQSENKYRKIFENVQDVFYQTDLNGIIIDMSPSIYRYSGYTREELIGTPSARYYWNPPDRIGMMKALQPNGEIADFEIQMRTKDDRLVHASINAHLILDGSGKPVGVEGSIRDISDRKRAEEELRETNELLELVFSAGHIMIAYMDRDFNFLRVNEAYAAFFESRPPEYFTGKNHFALYPYKENEAIFRTVVETGAPYNAYDRQFEFANHPERGITWWDWTLQPVKASDGTVMGLVMIMRNVTERRRSMEEKEQLERQLLQSQKMEVVGQLAGGIAHDFNNILTAIIGYGNLALLNMQKDEPLRTNIDHMLESADRAATLTRSLLALSRKQITERAPVDVNTVIKRVEKLLVRIIGEDIAIRLAPAEGAVTILADAGQLEQVFMNLATNARDAMPRGGSFTIETSIVNRESGFVTAHGYGQPGTYAVISVTDTGLGMDEETRAKIFEPFFTTKEVGRGTGLGLAMVYGILKQNGGLISVFSDPGKGSTFRMYFPLIRETAAEGKKAVDAEYPKGGTETILLAEDDASIRELTALILEQMGYRVITATDGEDAVARYRENKDSVQLLLFDLIMPKKNGKEAYDEIRKITPDIPILFASGYSADTLCDKGLNEHCETLIYKPMLPRSLWKKVREILDRPLSK